MSWVELISAAEAEHFIGRRKELNSFQHEISRLDLFHKEEEKQSWLTSFSSLFRNKGHALNLPLEAPQTVRYSIFYISGQGGVGKTTLLNRYREIARASHYLLAESDERQRDPSIVMGQIARQLSEQHFPLKRFNERYKIYRQKIHEIENDPQAPQGWGELLGKTVVRAAFMGANMVPGVDKIAASLPQDALAEQASQWTAYLLAKAFNKDDIALIQNPVPTLSKLFFKDLNEIAEKQPVLLIFENFEVTRSELQEWLLHLPEYEPSTRIRIAIGSRSEAGSNWDKLRSITKYISLDTFSPEEAERFLDTYSIKDQKRRQEILEHSGRLPVTMSWLAAPGDHTTEVVQPARDIVERFLQWVADPMLREVALRASIPRLFNRDTLEVLIQSREALLISEQQAFDWLQTMPFVKARSDGWQYHEVVRNTMLRYLRTASPQEYHNLHKSLAEFYANNRKELGLVGKEMWANEEWRKCTLAYNYHFLVAHPIRHWEATLSIFALALRRRRGFAQEILDLLCQEDVKAELSDSQNATLRSFQQAFKKLRAGTIQDGFDLFDQLCRIKGLSSEAQGLMLAYRGECYRLSGKWEEALKDFDTSLQLIPDDARALTRRSVAYILMGRYKDALADLKRAQTFDATDPWTLAMLGEVYRRLDQLTEALVYFDRAIALDEKHAWVIAIRGETYRQMGKYQLALADFKQALTLDEKDSWVAERLRETQKHIAPEIPLYPTSVQSLSIPAVVDHYGSPFTSQTSWNPPAPYLYGQQFMPPIPPSPSTPSSTTPGYREPPSLLAQPDYMPIPPIPPIPMSPKRSSRAQLSCVVFILIVFFIIITIRMLIFFHFI